MEVVVIDKDGYMVSGYLHSDIVIDGNLMVWIQSPKLEWEEVPSERVFEMNKPLPFGHPTVKKDYEIYNVGF